MLGKLLRRSRPDIDNGIKHCKARNMHDERACGRPALRGIDAENGFAVKRIRTQPIYRFRWKCDQSAVPQNLRGMIEFVFSDTRFHLRSSRLWGSPSGLPPRFTRRTLNVQIFFAVRPRRPPGLLPHQKRMNQ